MIFKTIKCYSDKKIKLKGNNFIEATFSDKKSNLYAYGLNFQVFIGTNLFIFKTLNINKREEFTIYLQCTKIFLQLL